ncbi:MAG: hypothetical protein U1A78_00140 [Polyangia bacterium]
METTDFGMATGFWLRTERTRLGLRAMDVARAVRSTGTRVESIEQEHSVVPPGWLPALQRLGMRVRPHGLPSEHGYRGEHLLRDRQRLRLSTQNLSTALGCSLDEVHEALRPGAEVPAGWLARLAELGCDVPEVIKKRLEGAPAEPAPPPAAERREDAAPSASPAAAAPDPSPEPNQRFRFTWTQGVGIELEVSEGLLKTMFLHLPVVWAATQAQLAQNQQMAAQSQAAARETDRLREWMTSYLARYAEILEEQRELSARLVQQAKDPGANGASRAAEGAKHGAPGAL